MRLLSLDYDPVYGDEVIRSSFLGDISVFDFDVVIWDPAASFSRYVSIYRAYYRGLPALAEHQSVQIKADARRRSTEFAEFVNSGRTLIVVVQPPQQCYVDTGEKEFSGTGKGRITTRMVVRFNLLSAIPLAGATFSRASGTRITYEGDGPIVRLLRKYKEYVRYSAVIANIAATSIAIVTGTDRIVGAIKRFKCGGYLILLPRVDFPMFDLRVSQAEDEGEKEALDDAEDSAEWLDLASEFQMDLLAAVSQLGGVMTASRPAWVERFATKRQRELHNGVLEQQKQIESARERLAELQQEEEAALARDQLYLGTGRSLELEVKAVLELLGGVVTEPEPGRDDWRVTFPEGDAVVEVKGVVKTAAEQHAAQLEKWVSGALMETGQAPKGILVVNAWREKPIDERTDRSFPDQMLPYSVTRNHCLVTGLQLFVMRAEVEADANRAVDARGALLRTAGPLEGYDDWQSIIQETKVDD